MLFTKSVDADVRVTGAPYPSVYSLLFMLGFAGVQPDDTISFTIVVPEVAPHPLLLIVSCESNTLSFATVLGVSLVISNIDMSLLSFIV